MDDENEHKTYYCPKCSENKTAVYVHYLGEQIPLPGNFYIIGMCMECLTREDPEYARIARAYPK